MERKFILPVFKNVNSEELRKKLFFKKKINIDKEIINELLLEGFVHDNSNKQLKKYLKQKLKSNKSSYFNNNNIMNHKSQNQSLYDKIKIGDIVYLKYKELEPKINKKQIQLQEKKLLNSKNYEVGIKVNSISPKTKSFSNSIQNEKNTNRVISLKHKKEIKKKILNPTFITIQNFNNNNDFSLPSNSLSPNNSNRSNNFYSSSMRIKTTRLIKKKNDVFKQNSINNSKKTINSEKNNSNNYKLINHSNSSKKIKLKTSSSNIYKIRPFTPRFSKIKRENILKSLRKKMENNINSKLDSLNLTQIEKQKELYNIINTLNKKNSKENIKKEPDFYINGILDIKDIKKDENEKITFNDTIKTKKGITGIVNLTKSKMIKWSDSINMITDEQILLYANNMINEYEKYSRNAGIGFVTLENGTKYLINSSEIEKTNKKLRDKLTSNSNKIISMNFSIGQKKIKLIQKYEKDINEGKINNNHYQK